MTAYIHAPTIKYSTISDDKLFDMSAYTDFAATCIRLLTKEDIDIYECSSKISAEIKNLIGRIQKQLGEEYKFILNSNQSVTDKKTRARRIHTNVSNLLKIWKSVIQPLINNYLREDDKHGLQFDDWSPHYSPAIMKMVCDVLLDKEYSFEGYSIGLLFPIYDHTQLEKTIFANHVHEANLRLLVSENGSLLDIPKLTNLINTYSLTAQKSWPTLLPLNKTHFLCNVIKILDLQHPSMNQLDLLTVHLDELTQYQDFNNFVSLATLFDITDKNIVFNILNRIDAYTVVLPALLETI